MFRTWITRAAWLAAAALTVLPACTSEPGMAVGQVSAKQIPAEGTCEADAMLRVVNEASFEELDVEAALDRRAAENIIAARPVATLAELDAIAYVGTSALHKILAFADARGEVAVCAASCDVEASLRVANEATFEELDVDAALDKRAAQNIVDARPFATIEELDAVPYVGATALARIADYAAERGFLDDCATTEIGIVSDLDKTVVPPANPDLSKAPYPGVTTLYQILEFQQGGQAGDMHYVTARQPEMVTEIPAYLEAHDVPGGPIDTGISGLPWVAEPEKVADVSAVLDATGDQKFVLFGDSSHRDPEVYKTIRAMYPERIIAGFIHKVNNTVSPSRVEGLHLHENYAQVAAVLYGLGVLNESEARAVMVDAQSEGLAISHAEIDALIEAHAP